MVKHGAKGHLSAVTFNAFPVRFQDSLEPATPVFLPIAFFWNRNANSVPILPLNSGSRKFEITGSRPERICFRMNNAYVLSTFSLKETLHFGL